MSAHDLGFVVGGSTRMAIVGQGTNAGNVGIGTTAPQVSLDIVASNNNPFSGNTLARITNTGTTGGILNLVGGGVGAKTFSLMSSGSGNAIGAGKFEIGNFAGTSYLVIDGSNGNVGIGASTPSATLDVVGTVSIMRTPTGGMTNTTYYTADTDLFLMCNGAGGTLTYMMCESGGMAVYSQNALPAVNQAGCTAVVKKGESYRCYHDGSTTLNSRVINLGK